MRRVGFIVSGSLDLKTGGYIYNRQMCHHWQQKDLPFTVITLPPPTHLLNEKERAFIVTTLNDPGFSTLLIDGLTGAHLGNELKSLRSKKRLIYLSHLPQLSNWKDEKEAIHTCHQIVVTSPYARKWLKEMDIKLPIKTILPGNSTAGEVKKNDYSVLVRKILFVGSMEERKDPISVIHALKKFVDIPWELTICGEINRNSDYLSKMKQVIADESLHKKIKIRGAIEPSELFELMRASDLLLSASHSETYGMAVAEAIDLHLPVLARSIEAFHQNFGEKVNYYTSEEDLNLALNALMKDHNVYQSIVDTIRRAHFSLPSWDESAVDLWQTINPK